MDYTQDENGVTTITSITDAPENSSTTLQLYDIFIPLLGVFIITLNAFVVFSSGLLLKKRQEPRSTYFFLGNVGLSDLLTGCAVLFGQFYPRNLRSELSCSIHLGMIVSSTAVSIFSITLVAIDRFFYILYGWKYYRYVYPNRARFSILITWILGGTIGFLPAMITSLRGSISSSQCWFANFNSGYILATTIIGVFPVLIIVGLYASILFKAMKTIDELKSASDAPLTREASTSVRLRYFKGSTTNILDQPTSTAMSTNHQEAENEEIATLTQNQDERVTSNSIFSCSNCLCRKNDRTRDDSNQSNRQPSKWKAIKVVMFTTGAFLITWIPYFVASTIFVYCDHENNPNFCNGLKVAIASPLAILGFSNSLLNPIIYAWWHTGFRTKSIGIYAERFENVKCCRWIFPKRLQTQNEPTSTTGISASTNDI